MPSNLAVRTLFTSNEGKRRAPAYGGFETPRPTWERIEAAVRALDHDRNRDMALSLHDPLRSEDYLMVTGGPRGCLLEAFLGERFLAVQNPFQTGGYAVVAPDYSFGNHVPLERHICRDFAKVLRIVRCFAEHGRLDPSVYWGPWTLKLPDWSDYARRVAEPLLWSPHDESTPDRGRLAASRDFAWDRIPPERHVRRDLESVDRLKQYFAERRRDVPRVQHVDGSERTPPEAPDA